MATRVQIQPEESLASKNDLFADVDTMEPDAFAKYLAQDCTMRFGNAPPLRGRDACRKAWASFCEHIDGVQHDILRTWMIDDVTIAETDVTYRRKDGGQVTVPVVTICRTGRGELIEDYRVYLDLEPVFAAGA